MCLFISALGQDLFGVNIINPFCYVALPSASGFQCLFGSVYDIVHLGTNGIINLGGKCAKGSEIETRSLLHHHLLGITALEESKKVY